MQKVGLKLSYLDSSQLHQLFLQHFQPGNWAGFTGNTLGTGICGAALPQLTLPRSVALHKVCLKLSYPDPAQLHQLLLQHFQSGNQMVSLATPPGTGIPVPVVKHLPVPTHRALPQLLLPFLFFPCLGQSHPHMEFWMQ